MYDSFNADDIKKALMLAKDRSLAVMDDKQEILDQGYNFPITTVAQYHESVAAAQPIRNVVSVLIDEGRTPYLLSMDALQFGLHPLTEVHDIMIDKVSHNEQNYIGVEILRGTLLVPLNTLLLWKK